MKVSAMGFIMLIFSTLLCFLAFVPFITPPWYLWMWQATVVSTEFGHWFAVLSIILWLLCLRGGQRYSAGILIVSAFVFFGPVFELHTHWQYWKVALDDRMGPEEKYIEAIPTFGALWKKTSLPQTSEKFFYRDNTEDSSRMEFFRARGNSLKPAPWVLVVPGGSWGEADPSSFWQLNSDLAESGIAVVDVSYRTLPKHIWPAQQEDILVAIDYIRTHAVQLGIAPDNWVILGRSAGGQIAESIAFEKKPPGLKGLISFYAPADISFAYRYSKPDDLLKTSILLSNFVAGEGNKAKEEAFVAASPIQFVNPKAPPTLLFHGPRDPLVWVLQSERLQQKLNANKVPVVLVEVPWGTHGFDYNYNGPGGQLSTYAVRRFLNKVLR